MPTEELVREALADVMDPELHMGIIELGLVYGVAVSGEKNEIVTVTMTLTSPMCPVGPEFVRAVETRTAEIPGVEKVVVDLVFVPQWDPRTMATDDVKLALGIW
jgi:metal-sulfur cluster biosynthetic enzyme